MMNNKQEVCCNNCGQQFSTDFLRFNGTTCSQNCFDNLVSKQTVCIMGENAPIKPEAVNNTTENALDAYKCTINRIDDWFEYTNESLADRKFIHEQLDSLTKKLIEIYKPQ